MVAGIHNKKGSLYVSDVTGNYAQYHTNAIGENDEKIRALLREKYKKDLNISKGVKLGIEIFKEVKEKFDINKFELVYLNLKEEKMKRLEGSFIETFINSSRTQSDKVKGKELK